MGSQKFDGLYAEFICQSAFGVQFGSPEYYSRYRSRYETLIKRFCSLAPAAPVDVLDIGGGQLALLCRQLWLIIYAWPTLLIIYNLKECKKSSGTCVSQNSHLQSNLTLSSFPKLLSIYRG
jgi:hypothetical protein